jgi:hypothetical protein
MSLYKKNGIFEPEPINLTVENRKINRAADCIDLRIYLFLRLEVHEWSIV